MEWVFSYMGSLENRLRLVLGILIFGLVCGMAISWNLWMGNRDFPYFPVFNFIPQFPGFLGACVIIAFWVLLGAMVWKPQRQLFIAVISLMFIFGIQDQIRWQPWFYQYGLMFIPFVFCKWNRASNKEVIGLLQMVVVMIYLWGGIHKCHVGFINVWNESMIAPLLESVQDETVVSVLGGAGYLVAPVEILIAFGLLFKPTRMASIIGALVSHVTILVLLGPVKGFISNPVVWPWNMAMMALVIVLFYKVKELPLFAFRKSQMAIAGYCIWGLMLIAPGFFYVNLWDRYLSFNLYSGRQARLLVFIRDSDILELPEEWSDRYSYTLTDGYKILNSGEWCREELNVPMITEKRILRRFSEYVAQYEPEGEAFIYFIDYPRLHDRAASKFTSDQLENISDMQSK